MGVDMDMDMDDDATDTDGWQEEEGDAAPNGVPTGAAAPPTALDAGRSSDPSARTAASGTGMAFMKATMSLVMRAPSGVRNSFRGGSPGRWWRAAPSPPPPSPSSSPPPPPPPSPSPPSIVASPTTLSLVLVVLVWLGLDRAFLGWWVSLGTGMVARGGRAYLLSSNTTMRNMMTHDQHPRHHHHGTTCQATQPMPGANHCRPSTSNR